MIRALRIALANWIMPKRVMVEFQCGETNLYELHQDQITKTMQFIRGFDDDAKVVVAAVKTFPGGLTVWPKP